MINQIMKVCHNIENIQYNAALAITGTIRGTFQMKFATNQTLNFSSLDND